MCDQLSLTHNLSNIYSYNRGVRLSVCLSVRLSVIKNFLEIEINPAQLIEHVICINEIGFIFF